MAERERAILSGPFCKAILRYFWICYRHGLEDACVSGDIGDCEETASRLLNPAYFGTVRCELDWNEWQFKSLQWTREDMCRARIMDLVMSLRKPTHKFGFLMQLAKMYYARGLRDWMECRDWLTVGMIARMPSYPYLLKKTHSYRQSMGKERFESFQSEVFNLISVMECYGGEAGEYYVPKSRFKLFVECVWLALQKPMWFDDYDVETDSWDDLNPTEGVSVNRIMRADSYTDKGKGIKKHGNDNKHKREGADRSVPRKNKAGGDAPAGGPVLQQGAARRRRGRPPKVL